MTTQTGLPATPEQAQAQARSLQPPVIEASASGLVVTSLTIAQGAGVTHQATLNLIEKHMTRLERFGQVGFEIRAGYNNSQVRIALLNEQQSTLLLTMMRNTNQVLDFKVALVDGFYRMAEQVTAPANPASMSRLEILQLAMAAEQENQELKAQAALDAPKVGYFDTMVADNDYHLLRSVASDLNVGERDLRTALKFCGWLYVESYRRRNSKGDIVTEYQWSEYAEKKPYFHRVMNHDAPLFRGNVPYTLKVTTPGAAAISRFVAKLNARHGSVRDALPTLEQEYDARRAKNNQAAKESAGLW